MSSFLMNPSPAAYYGNYSGQTEYSVGSGAAAGVPPMTHYPPGSYGDGASDHSPPPAFTSGLPMHNHSNGMPLSAHQLAAHQGHLPQQQSPGNTSTSSSQPPPQQQQQSQQSTGSSGQSNSTYYQGSAQDLLNDVPTSSSLMSTALAPLSMTTGVHSVQQHGAHLSHLTTTSQSSLTQLQSFSGPGTPNAIDRCGSAQPPPSSTAGQTAGPNSNNIQLPQQPQSSSQFQSTAQLTPPPSVSTDGSHQSPVLAYPNYREYTELGNSNNSNSTHTTGSANGCSLLASSLGTGSVSSGSAVAAASAAAAVAAAAAGQLLPYDTNDCLTSNGSLSPSLTNQLQLVSHHSHHVHHPHHPHHPPPPHHHYPANGAAASPAHFNQLGFVHQQAQFQQNAAAAAVAAAAAAAQSYSNAQSHHHPHHHLSYFSDTSGHLLGNGLLAPALNSSVATAAANQRKCSSPSNSLSGAHSPTSINYTSLGPPTQSDPTLNHLAHSSHHTHPHGIHPISAHHHSHLTHPSHLHHHQQHLQHQQQLQQHQQQQQQQQQQQAQQQQAQHHGASSSNPYLDSNATMGFNGLMYHLNPLSPHSPSPTLMSGSNQSPPNQLHSLVSAHSQQQQQQQQLPPTQTNASPAQFYTPSMSLHGVPSTAPHPALAAAMVTGNSATQTSGSTQSQRSSSPLSSVQAPVTTYKWMHVKRNPPKPG
jgi:hypothetical protein